jgi:hypothetical protein
MWCHHIEGEQMTTTAQGDLILDKTLRDGRRIELRIVPQTDKPGTLAYWLAIHWPGRAAQTFTTRPHKVAQPPAPGVTHAIRLPGPDGKLLNLGLTGPEAASIADGTAAWVKARQDARDAERAATGAAAREAAPGARTWQVPDAYGHLTAVGQAARLADGTAVTALAHSSTYYREDGMTFGAADDAGYVYFTEVREATPAELAGLEAREGRQVAREEIAARGEALFSAPDAEIPCGVTADLSGLPGARVEPERELTLGFGIEGCYQHLRADEDGGWLWALTWNGADGDDWGLCNCGSYIARRLPLTPERRALFGDLAASFGAITARNG